MERNIADKAASPLILLFWILMAALRRSAGAIDINTFPRAVARYARELKRLGIELPTDKSNIDASIQLAIDCQILGLPIKVKNKNQLPIDASIEVYLKDQNLLSDIEVQHARQAAEITKHKFAWGHQDDDLEVATSDPAAS